MLRRELGGSYSHPVAEHTAHHIDLAGVASQVEEAAEVSEQMHVELNAFVEQSEAFRLFDTHVLRIREGSIAAKPHKHPTRDRSQAMSPAAAVPADQRARRAELLIWPIALWPEEDRRIWLRSRVGKRVEGRDNPAAGWNERTAEKNVLFLTIH